MDILGDMLVDDWDGKPIITHLLAGALVTACGLWIGADPRFGQEYPNENIAVGHYCPDCVECWARSAGYGGDTTMARATLSGEFA